MTLNTKGLLLTYSECRSLRCGLRWDPEEMPGERAVDLDLGYVLYDEYGHFISSTSGKDDTRSNNPAGIYHSGDETSGSDDSDDERVTIDLIGLKKKIFYIFLTVEISSDHTFENVRNPAIRIVEGLENDHLFEVSLSQNIGAKTRSFIFARLDRKPGGWSLNTLSTFLPGAELPDWEKLLIDYLPDLPDEKDLNLPPTPELGKAVPLFYTKEAKHRVMCGVSWDANTAKNAIDVDLTCIMYDSSGEYIEDVSSEASRAIDDSGAIYHSGDDTTGAGDGDDEIIMVELVRLPSAVHHIVFVVDMKTNHTLNDIKNPAIRIADAASDYTQLNANFTGGGTDNAYIFARLFKKGDEWRLHYIGKSVDTAELADWSEAIEPYLGTDL